tara:strand:+ start:512 stop:916 length:405 start_codon:yes stop_codon:yes gene_type:complete
MGIFDFFKKKKNITADQQKQINDLFNQINENSDLKNLFNETFATKVENGLDEKFYENGQLKKQSTIVDGYKNGIEKTWYEDGTLKEECNYKNGMLNGTYIWYREDGSKQIKEMKNGQPIKCQEFDENGNLESEE